MFGAIYKYCGHDKQEYEIYLPGCENIDKLLMARKLYAYGIERNYCDHDNCIGWTRTKIKFAGEGRNKN